jgi:hypothetical protein
VLAGEVARLRRELDDLRGTVLARMGTVIARVSPSGSNDIDLTGIPQTYTHLELWFAARALGSFVDENLNVRVNNDSGADSHQTIRVGALAGADPTTTSGSGTLGTFARITGASQTGSRFTRGIMRIPWYRETGAKILLTEYSFFAGTTATNTQVARRDVHWVSNSPITRLTIFAPTGGWNTGSRFSLRGVF